MATQQTATAGRALVSPSVILLFIWMIVPLVMTLYFSTLRYSLLDPDNSAFVGLQNYTAFLTDPAQRHRQSLQRALLYRGVPRENLFRYQ